MGERELADDTGLARSAYMSSESALCTELLRDEADDTEDTLLTLSDLRTQWRHVWTQHTHTHTNTQNLTVPGFPVGFSIRGST